MPPGDPDAAPLRRPNTSSGARLVRIRRGTHGLLEDSGPLGSQPLPRIRRMRDVLYGVAVSRRVRRPEIERAEVDRIVRRAIYPMEGDTDKALSLHVLASDVELDGAVTELDPA